VDEFYSWLYAERCSFKEIILLKDFGIGHPPLYHVLQKLVQSSIPYFHPICVRVANYIVGSLFIILSVRIFLAYRKVPIFCYWLCFCATILNSFVFSRMWGLVLLFSFLLLRSGEKYNGERSWKNLLSVVISFLGGLLSDYNFIILSPYLVYLFIATRKRSAYLLVICIAGLTMLWIGGVLSAMYLTERDVGYLVDRIVVKQLIWGGFTFGKMLIGVRYWELFLLCLLLVHVISHIVVVKAHFSNDSGFHGVLVVALYYVGGCSLLWHLLDSQKINGKYGAAIAIISIGIVIWKVKKRIGFSLDDFTKRILFSIIGAVLIVLSVDPFFWRHLIEERFFAILMPFILICIYLNCKKILLYSLTVVFVISGVLYVPSGYVGWWYPPPKLEKSLCVGFQNERAYSTQYFFDRQSGITEPIFVGNSEFKRWCQVCEVGTGSISLENCEKLGLVLNYRDNSNEFLLPYFQIISERILVTEFDNLFLKHLRPFNCRRYKLVECERIGNES